MIYFLIVFSFLAAFVFTFFLIKAGWKSKILDVPIGDRKIHTKPVPLLGGTAIFLAFFIVVFLQYYFQPGFFTHFEFRQLLGIFLASSIIIFGGFFDDKYNLRPVAQFLFALAAVLVVIAFGVNLREITNPFGNKIDLTGLFWGGRFLAVDAIVFIWLLGMMFTTKLLDGVDGLVAGITAIGSLMIGILSLTPKFFQADVAFLAFVFAAANLGFLIFNFHPAKIFLGEGGSLLTGFILGFLAIAAGGKIATALLVMGVATVDILFVVARRIKRGGSLFKGGSEHLHFQLLQTGLSVRKVVFIFYFLAIIFGILTLFLQSRQKLFSLIVLFLLAAVLSWFLEDKIKKK